jgi:CshA-type fibril repeat protein
MGAVRAAGFGLIFTFAATVTVGAQTAAAASTAMPAAPAPATLTSAGAGTTPQTVTLPVPADGQVALLDSTGTATSTLSVPGVGSYQLDDGTGVLTFRPAVGYIGAHGVLFRETDAFEQVGEGSYTPQVTIPEPPVVAPLATTGTGAATQTVSTAVPSGGNVVLLDGTGQATTSTVLPGVGEFRIDPVTGVLSFAPVLGYTGSPGIDVRTTDAYGQSAAGTWTANVLAPNAPVALALSSRAVGGVQQTARVDVPAGTCLALVDADGQPTAHAFLAGQGNYALDAATSTIVFTPAQGFFGAGSLTYQLTDAYGQVSRNAYTPTVLPPPVVKSTVAGRPAVVAKPRKRPVTVHAVQPVQPVPPVELVAPKPAPARHVVHRVTTRVPTHPLPVRAHVKRLPHAASPAVTAKATPVTAVTVEAPLAAAVPVVATSGSEVSSSTGKLAGLALIGVNLFVGLTALVLNRRRRTD